MANPANSVIQNLLPVQAYFSVDGVFQTFIGQGQPFYASINPNQSGLNITSSVINSTTIGATTPSTGIFTNIGTTTGTISTTPSGNTDIANKFYVDTVAQGLGPKAACAVGTTANITLSGLQTIDTYTTVAGDRVLVKNQTTSANNGIYIASASAWTRSTDMDVWSEVPGAYTVLLNGGQSNTGWVCTATTSGTIGVTAMPWVQFSAINTYFAGTGLNLASNTFSIANTGVTAASVGSASKTLTATVNAQGQLTTLADTNIAISASQTTSGIFSSSLLSGSYTGITGVGTLTAGIWNASTIGVAYGGTGANTLTGYVKGSGTSAFTATSTIPNTDISGLGTMSTQNANSVAITGGSISGLSSFILTGQTGYVYANGSSAVTSSTTIPTSALSGNFVSTFSAGTTGFTPSSNTAGAVTLAGTLNVANGGTGVTSSSGANSVVLRDANGNITTNCLFEGYVTQAASGTTITLIASSAQNYQITGSGGQVIKLPDATTLPNGATFTFNNNQSSGVITVQNNSSTTIATINSGGYVIVVLLSNSIAAGSWDRHDSTPSNVSWSTNTLDYPGSITSASWNGNVIAINRGGTNGTATPTAGGVAYGSGTAYAFTSAGTSGQVLTSAGSGTPTWSTPTSYATVTDDTTTNATRYPLYAAATSGNLTTEYVASTKYQFNPSTGVLTATQFSGSGAGLTSIPNSALTNSSVTIGSTAVALGATVATFAGLTSVTSTTFVGALTGNASSATTATTATNATNTAITDDTTTATSVYPTWVTTTTGNLPQKTASTKLSFVPSTGVLSATSFSGAGTGLTGTASSLSIGGNSATVTNGVYTTGSYSNPSWITSILGSIVSGNISGNASNVTGTVAVANGGTGLTTTPANGALDIGNGTGFTRTTLTAGSGISVTNSAGGITIANTSPSSGGTVTSVAALTLGTTGTDLSSTVSNSTTTPVITLNVPTASATNRGALSAADWTTFNNKGSGTVTSVTGTSPIVSSGGNTPAISLATSYGDTLNPYASKTANYVLAAPNGTAGVPTFRAIVAADIPTLNQNTTGTASNITATSNSTLTTLSSLSLPGSQISGNISGNAANVTGTVAIANGGTGATSASAALTNLGAYPASNPSGYTNNTGTVTSVSGTGTVNGLTLTGTVTTSGSLTLGGTLSNIANSALTNSSVTVGTTAISLGSSSLTLGGLTSVAVTQDPTSALQLATKQYVDNTAQGLSAKAAVYVATTANITLSGEQTIDGFTTSSSRVLVKNQTTSSQNGIYVSSSGAWTRSTDADTWGELVSAFVFVSQGTINGDTGWTCTVDAGGTLGTTAVTWVQFSGAGTYTAGTGLTLTGTQFSITNVGTANTYGSATQTPVLTTNAQGQVTSVTNTTITPAIGSVTGLGTGVATFLATPTSANLATALTDETGSGALVFATSPTLVTPILGTPQSGNFSTGTFTWPTFNQNTTGTAANITASSNSTLTTLSALSLPGSQVSGNISGNSANVTGTVAVANGGTGLTTTPANGALDIGNGTGFTRTTLTGTASQVAVTNASGSITLSLPSTINVNTSGSAASLSSTLAIASGGTGQTTASAAFNALSPVTSTGDLIIGNGVNSATRLAIGTNGYVLTSNGTTATWSASTGGVTSFQTSLSGLTPNTASTGAVTLAGTLGISSGGSGQTTAQLAMNAFAGAVTSGSYLRGNGTNVVMSTIQAADVPTLNQNTTGTATYATNIANGANLQIPYNTGSGATSFIAAPTIASTYLQYNGTGFAWASAAGLGTVTSVALALPSIFTVSGSPVTTSGTLTGTLNTQSANLIFAGPSSGASATPTFRSLVSADIPNPALTTKTTTYTITTTDGTILCDATSAAFTVTLPTAVSATGKTYIVKKTDSSANAVTIATTSSQTIDTISTQTLGIQSAWLVIQSDGSNWQIVG
jgi:hypothetical protein